jgi:membrane-bound metal-dependent hydrolase YbcI (DUF457 family)
MASGLPQLLMIAGFLVAFIGGIRLIVTAFTSSFLWGLVSVVLHPLILIWVVLYWHEAKGPFLNYAAGWAMILAGAKLGGGIPL